MIYISNKEILQIFESNIYEHKSHAGKTPLMATLTRSVSFDH